MRFFIDENSTIWNINLETLRTAYPAPVKLSDDLKTIYILSGEKGKEGEVVNEFVLWENIGALTATTHFANEDFDLDALRSDLIHQLKIPDEIDWDYFLETALRARSRAEIEGRNFNLSRVEDEKQQ